MHSEARVDSTCGDLVWRCLVDSVSGRLADAECRTCTPCTLLLGTPPHFRLNVHVDCSVQSTAARAVVQGAGGRGNLVLHPHGVRVWATKLDGDGRVPLKIEGSRFDRQSLYRLRKLCGYFTQKLHPDTKLGFFRLTIHIAYIDMQTGSRPPASSSQRPGTPQSHTRLPSSSDMAAGPQ